jgi:hypothetical protein
LFPCFTDLACFPRLRDLETYVDDAVALTFAAIGFVGVFSEKQTNTARDKRQRFG